MRFDRLSWVLLLALFSLGLPAPACIWDSDTIEDELRGIPEAAVLATGRWYRHGSRYYEQRVERLGDQAELTLDEYDDLAVAYERLGQREKALATLERKVAYLEDHPDPDHLYRYHANKGTILAHSGRLIEGVLELERAVRLNPNAHFGRERYQIDLIRYIVACQENPELWSEHNFLSWAGYQSSLGFSPIARLSFDYERILEATQFDETPEAFQAVAGMLRFGGMEGPELYRCLGDLSLLEGNLNLAWLFYLRALEKNHPAHKQIETSILSIERHWKEAGYKSHPTRTDFQEIDENAAQWLRAFQQREDELLSQGGEPELESILRTADEQVPARPLSRKKPRTRLWAGVVALVLALLGIQYRRRLAVFKRRDRSCG